MIATNRSRHGLTLLELIIVLVILVGLAGIVIPLLPDVVLRSHAAVGATNTTEINRIVQTHQRLYQAYPDELDNLAGTAAPIDYLPGLTVTPVQITKVTLTAPYVLALKNAGIINLAELHPTRTALTTANGSPTFKPYVGTGVQPVADGLPVAQIDETAVETTTRLVRDKTGINGDVYLVFGFGKRSSAIGTVIGDAPVHFGKLSSDRAGSMYCRYGLVFRVVRGGATPTALTEAQFVGTVSFQDTGIVATDGQLADYYDNMGK